MDSNKVAWVERFLGVRIAEPSLQEPRPPSDDPLDLRNRLNNAAKAINVMKAEGDPALPDLLKALLPAADAVKGGRPEAAELMNRLEEVLARARQAAQHRSLSQEFKGKVDYAKLLLRWHNAQTRVLTNIQQLSARLETNEEVLADDDPDEILDMIESFPDLIPQFGRALDDVLDECLKPNADLEALHEEALDILRDYRAEVLKVEALRGLEVIGKDIGLGTIGLVSEFENAFDEMEDMLNGR